MDVDFVLLKHLSYDGVSEQITSEPTKFEYDFSRGIENMSNETLVEDCYENDTDTDGSEFDGHTEWL